MNFDMLNDAGHLDDNLLAPLVDKLAPYDPADLLAAIAGLQLLSENADHIVRLEAFAHAAAALDGENGAHPISSHRLKQLANTEPLGGQGVAQQEDPCDNALTEAFTYHGGMFIVFPGHVDESTFHLRHLALAVSAHPLTYHHPDFVDRAEQVLRAVLALSTEIARRAGLGRGAFPIFRGRNADVFVPDSQRLAALKHAVSFSRKEMEDFLAHRHLPPSALDWMVTQLGSVTITGYQIDQSGLQTRPIVQVGDQLIIAIPGMLLVAARHALVRLAFECGVEEILARHYHASVWQSVVQSLECLGNPSLEQRAIVSATIPCVHYALFHMDTDKLICAVLATDAFEHYPADRAFSAWPWQQAQAQIRAQICIIEEILFNSATPPNEILFLVLLQSSGRTLIWDYQELETIASPLLILTAADLETIAFLESGEQLALWKYARHSAQIREHTHVWAATELSEFALYRSGGYSYTIPDRERPEAIHLLPGGAGDLRRKVLHDYDPHGVPSYVPHYITDVITMYGTHEVPLYIPLHPHDHRAACLVEGLPLPIWVIGPGSKEGEAQETLGFSPTIAAGIAYWLWQCTPSLNDLLQPLIRTFPCIVLECRLCEASPGAPASQRDSEEQMPIEVAVDLVRGTLLLQLNASFNTYVADAQNAGERTLLREVLQGLRALSPKETQSMYSDEVIATILDRHVPLGMKKMLLYTDVNAEPDLDPRQLPKYRSVQGADTHDLLDELGDYLRHVEHIEPGPLPGDQRTAVLRKVVAFYYRELAKVVASLNPEHLLEFLVALQEGTVYESAYQHLTIPTQTACFSTIPDMVARLSTEIPELTNVAIAGRFLVEYIAACPPHGMRPISMSVYDRLLALAAHIITFGFASDMIHFNIADIRLEMLPSGRLIINQEQYLKAKAAYLPHMLTTVIENTTEAFAQRWYSIASPEEAPATPGTPPALEKAALAEFGCSLSDLQRFLAGAFAISEPLDTAWACLAHDEFLDRQAKHLGWSKKHIANVLENLALSTRPDFLSPSDPYRPDEVYPWRYNRRLSWVRRPFILRATGEHAEVLWGNRLLYQASLTLLRLCHTGLFPADSQRMKQVMGSILHREGETFNTLVAETLERHPGLIVAQRVKGIGDLPGDIDVLVADPQAQRLGILECKNFRMARTPHEIAHELEKLFTGKHGGPTQSEKRAEWARKHVGDLLEKLGLDRKKAGKWHVEPLIVVSQDLFSPYLQRSSIPVISLSKLLRERLW